MHSIRVVPLILFMLLFTAPTRAYVSCSGYMNCVPLGWAGRHQATMQYPLLTFSNTPSDTAAFKTFEMRPGSCLRGPLRFFDKKEAVIFELKAGVEYPVGCGGRR